MSNEKLKDKPILKFVHTADLHLGSPFQSMNQYDSKTASKLSAATYDAFNKIIDLCIDEQVDFLLISGDIYDGKDKNIKAQLAFRNGLNRLDQHGIKSFIVYGNHDPLSSWSKKLKLPEETIRFSNDKPEIYVYKSKDGNPIAYIVGASFDNTKDAKNAVEMFPEKDKEWPFTIGLVHCSIGFHEGHDPYASIDDLKRCGYNYWALGHIHKPEILHECEPAITYSGNPQGRDMGETGPRGCYLITVDQAGQMWENFFETSIIRWETIQIPINDIYSIEDLLEKIRESLIDYSHIQNRDIICRIELTGYSQIYPEICNELDLTEYVKIFNENPIESNFNVIVDKIINHSFPIIDRNHVKERKDIVGDMCKIVDNLKGSDTNQKSIHNNLDELFKNSKYRLEINYPNDEELIDIIDQAEAILLSKMVGGAE